MGFFGSPILTLIILMLFSGYSFASEQGGKAIIGVDNRYEVTDPSVKPHSMVGSLTYTYTGRTGKCTASLVSPDLILTNAHCVISKGTSKSYQHSNFKFRPQFRTGVASPEVDAYLLEWGTNDPNNQPSVDWALLKLAMPLGNYYGYFHVSGLRGDRTNSLIGKTLSTSGYPGDKQSGNQMWAHNGCKFTGVRADRNSNNYGYLKHNCDTKVGASGSPLYANEGGKYVIYGLHNRGASTNVSEANVEDHNGAVQPQEIFDAIKRNSNKTTYTELQIEAAVECSGIPVNSEIDKLAEDIKKIEKYLVSENRSGFILCNQMDKPYKVARAFEEVVPASEGVKASVNWTSVGIRTIDAKTCSNFDAGQLKTSDVYLYIEGWGGAEKSFCIKSEGRFQIPNADGKCPEDAISTPFTNKFSLSNEKPEIFDILE